MSINLQNVARPELQPRSSLLSMLRKSLASADTRMLGEVTGEPLSRIQVMGKSGMDPVCISEYPHPEITSS